MNRLLAVDDDSNFLISLKKVLEMKGYLIDILNNPHRLFDKLEESPYDILLLDIKMPGYDGITLFKRVNSLFPQVPVIMVSGQSDIKVAVEAIKNGAYDFLEKPLDTEKLFLTIEKALSTKKIIDEKENLFNELKDNYLMIGESPAFIHLVNQIKQISDTNAKILIEGESGTGKELIAWAIHHNSSRSGKPYVKLNCAAIPPDLLESELFGHKKGSFTGAINDREGKFISANTGTLFLDEIGDLPLSLQAKILRALEDSEVEIIGENIPVKIDVRIISATNKNLSELVKKNEFREDLFYRLNVIKIFVPPLRQRKEDIIPLAYYFLKKFCNEYNKQITSFSKQVEGYLINQEWKGNIRELKSFVEKLVVYSNTGIISIDDLIKVYNYSNTEFNVELIPEELNGAKMKFEKEHIFRILEESNWSISKTSEKLGIDRTNLFKKMKKYGIKKDNI